MYSKLHTTTTKLKRVSIVLVSVLSALILAILPLNLTASAVNVVDNTDNTVISLPFPSPSSFGEASRAIVIYNSVQQRFTMYVLTFNLGPSYTDPSNIRFIMLVPSISNNMFNSLTLRVEAMPPVFSGVNSDDPSSYYVADCRLYRFNWYVGQSNYTVARRTLEGANSPHLIYDVSANSVSPLTYTSGNSSSPYELDMRYNVCYNGAWVDKVANSNISYSFSSSEGGALLSAVNNMNSSIDGISDKLSATNNHLSNINNNVVFYCQQILDKLSEGSDYAPDETTSNADMSNYENAEGALMDNNIQNLNNLDMPDLGSFNSGSQNNAFKFISSNIEFFSGMNGQGSVAKIATVLFVILGLGLTSFIIGLSNRKKGG